MSPANEPNQTACLPILEQAINYGSVYAALFPSELANGRMKDLALEIDHLNTVMSECCDAIRDNDEMGALRMLEVCLTGGGRP